MQQKPRRHVEEIPLADLNATDNSTNETDEHWKQVFDNYDHDHSGNISLVELTKIIKSSEYKHDIPDKVIKRIMTMADRDRNGHLDFEEFLFMIHMPILRPFFQHLLHVYIDNIIPPRRHDTIVIYSFSPPPIMMVLMSILEITLFVVDAVYGYYMGNGPTASHLIYNPFKRHEAWRFLSYMFVHVGWLHLVANLLVQILLGVPLEMVHRWWRVMLVYGAGVVAGSLGTSITDPRVFLAGASGGVYALIAAHLSNIILNWSEMKYALPQLLFFLVYISMDFGSAIYNRYVLDVAQNIGYVAHITGAIAGLLVGIGILKNLEVKSWEKILWWISVVVFFILLIIAIFMNIFWTQHFPATRYDYK